MIKEYDAKAEEMEKVLADAEAYFEDNLVPMKIVFQMNVAIEEIFVNIASYAYDDKVGNATVEINVDGTSCTVVFTDSGKPFNPLEKTDPDVTLAADERAIGGLGIYMVKKSMDEVSYERKGDCNVFRIIKKW